MYCCYAIGKLWTNNKSKVLHYVYLTKLRRLKKTIYLLTIKVNFNILRCNDKMHGTFITGYNIPSESSGKYMFVDK